MWCAPRFDGRTIRVDKASDTGPRGGYGGRGGGPGGFGQRGGFGGSPHMGQMPFGQQHQQYPMAGPPMYAPQYGGRGGYPPQVPQYGGPPAQGTADTLDQLWTKDNGTNQGAGWQQAPAYGYADQQQQMPQQHQQQSGQGQPQQPQQPQGGQGY